MSETIEVKTSGSESYIERDDRTFLLNNDPDDDSVMEGDLVGRETELRQFMSAVLTGDSRTGKTFFIRLLILM